VGYDTLIQALLAEGDAKVREIDARAEAEAREVIDRAVNEAEEDAERRARLAAEDRARDRKAVLVRAGLRARRMDLSARWAAIREAFAAAERRLFAAAGTPGYAAVLRALADDALPPIESGGQPSGEVSVVVDGRDAAEWKPILDARRVPWAAEQGRDDVRCGLEVMAEGGRVRIRNSYRSRLDRIMTEVAAEIEALWCASAAEPRRG
jgi:vacuolar-type H+-ATPase subunit E/Vma4